MIVRDMAVSKSTVYTWIAKRGMPAHKPGRRRKFQKEVVGRWLKAGGASGDGARGEPDVA